MPGVRADERRSIDPADLVVFAVFVAYAIWTIAFWVALAMGRGWGVAGPLWLLTSIAAAVPAYRRLANRPISWTGFAGSTAAWIVLAAACVAVLPGDSRIGRAGVGLLLVAALAAVESPGRPRRWEGSRLVMLAAAGALTATMLATWFGFIAGVLALSVWAAWREFGRGSNPRHAAAHRAATPAAHLPAPTEPAALTAPVLAAGALFALYQLVTTGYALDQGHYLNKSLHYADNPWSFGIRDYMFGVDGVDHIPRGTILNSFETGIGFASAITRIATPTLTYQVAVPVVSFLLPMLLAWTARVFGARRPDLVGCVGLIAMVWFPDGHDTRLLVLKLAEGKSTAGVIAIVVFIGAMLRLMQRADTASLVLACATAVATYGLSSTSGIALLPAAVAAIVTGALVHRGADDTIGRVKLGLVPLGVVVVMTALGLQVHRTISTGLDRFGTSFEPWLTRFAGRSANVSTDGREFQIWLLVGCVVLVVLFGRTATQRLYFGITLAGLVLVVYNPVLFETLWDSLGVTGLSWRAAWALPVGLAVGLAVDALDGQASGPDEPTTELGTGWVAILLVGALFAIGVPPTANEKFDALRSLPPAATEAAEALIDATPVGGRFLAPQSVETVAIGLTDDRYPTVVRPYFVNDLASYPELPATFLPAERMALARAINPSMEPTSLGGATWTDDPAILLDLVGVDAVCIPPDAGAALRQTLRRSWVRVSNHDICNVFARR